MKQPSALIATTIGATVLLISPAAAQTPQPGSISQSIPTEFSLRGVVTEIDLANRLLLVSGDRDDEGEDDRDEHDDDDDDDERVNDEDCNEDGTGTAFGVVSDENCMGNATTEPQPGTAIPPANGLFRPGTVPQVKSN